ncbi:dihydroneopterin aldolase [Loigolactobacillus backii]|nr:dihydroneopterin aldolase [Loigolactobacillus backii]PIO83100.1 dihydroneopterin aldolase [Loigolactobacillus backii]
MGQIKITNMQFYTYNGVLKEENKLGQRLEVDVALQVLFEKIGTKDDLRQTVNYAAVYQTIAQVVKTHQYQLIESLANYLTQVILAAYSKVMGIKLELRKYSVPIDGIFDHVAVVSEVKRDDA